MSNIQEILDAGYQIKVDDILQHSIRVTNPEGVLKVIPLSSKLSRDFGFCNGAIMISEKEIFDHFFKLTDEEMCQWRYGYGTRTKEYFDNLRSSIGYCGYECIDDFSGTHTSENLKKTGYYFTDQYTEIDNFGEIRYYFNHYPSEYEVKVAKIIEDSGFSFRTGSWHEEFICWECGRKVHWLDISGNVIDKLEKMEDKYCGC